MPSTITTAGPVYVVTRYAISPLTIQKPGDKITALSYMDVEQTLMPFTDGSLRMVFQRVSKYYVDDATQARERA